MGKAYRLVSSGNRILESLNRIIAKIVHFGRGSPGANHSSALWERRPRRDSRRDAAPTRLIRLASGNGVEELTNTVSSWTGCPVGIKTTLRGLGNRHSAALISMQASGWSGSCMPSNRQLADLRFALLMTPDIPPTMPLSLVGSCLSRWKPRWSVTCRNNRWTGYASCSRNTARLTCVEPRFTTPC